MADSSSATSAKVTLVVCCNVVVGVEVLVVVVVFVVVVVGGVTNWKGREMDLRRLFLRKNRNHKREGIVWLTSHKLCLFSEQKKVVTFLPPHYSSMLPHNPSSLPFLQARLYSTNPLDQLPVSPQD